MNRLIALFFMLTLIGIFFIPSDSVFAADDTFKVSGYSKSLAFITDFRGFHGDIAGKDASPEVALQNPLRISLSWQHDESLFGEIAYEIIPVLQEADALQPIFTIQAAEPLSYRAVDFDERMYPSDESDRSSFQIHQNLDRVYMTLSPHLGDLTVGRQAVAFGSAHAINPTDIFTSFTYTELNKEERIGVDAVRLKIPTGTLSEVDMGIVFGDNFSSAESAAFLRTKFYLFETDFSPMVTLFKENMLVGFDIARSLGGAGFWLEGAYTFANMADDHNPDKDYLRISTGLDYSFTDKLYAFLEYHYNAAGKSDPDDYSELLGSSGQEIAYTEGAVYLLGEHYLAPGLNYQVAPLLTLSAQALYNMGDSSLLLVPDLQYSVTDDMVIEAGAFIGIGPGSDITQNGFGNVQIATNSEFGLYPDIYFLSVRLYF